MESVTYIVGKFEKPWFKIYIQFLPSRYSKKKVKVRTVSESLASRPEGYWLTSGPTFDFIFLEYQCARVKINCIFRISVFQLSNDTGHVPYLQTDSMTFLSESVHHFFKQILSFLLNYQIPTWMPPIDHLFLSSKISIYNPRHIVFTLLQVIPLKQSIIIVSLSSSKIASNPLRFSIFVTISLIFIFQLF